MGVQPPPPQWPPQISSSRPCTVTVSQTISGPFKIYSGALARPLGPPGTPCLCHHIQPARRPSAFCFQNVRVPHLISSHCTHPTSVLDPWESLISGLPTSGVIWHTRDQGPPGAFPFTRVQPWTQSCHAQRVWVPAPFAKPPFPAEVSMQQGIVLGVESLAFQAILQLWVAGRFAVVQQGGLCACRVVCRPGICRGVDMEKRLYHILTPVPPEQLRLVNCLLVGAISIPQCVLKSQVSPAPRAAPEPTGRAHSGLCGPNAGARVPGAGYFGGKPGTVRVSTWPPRSRAVNGQHSRSGAPGVEPSSQQGVKGERRGGIPGWPFLKTVLRGARGKVTEGRVGQEHLCDPRRGRQPVSPRHLLV